MPVYIQNGKISRYCDVPDCNAEVLGLLKCHCSPCVRVFCEEHACSCATREEATA